MFRRKARTTWLFRVAVSYILAFTLPFLLFVLGSWYFFARISESEIEGYARESLASARTLFDREILRMTAIGKSVSRDVGIRYFTDLDDPMSVLAFERKLVSLVESDPFFVDLLYYDQDRSIFVGSQSVYGPDAVIRQFFLPGEMDPYILHQALVSIREPGFLFLEKGARGATAFHLYAYPLSSIPELSAVLIFVIPAGNLERTVGSPVHERALTRLYDPRGNLVYLSGAAGSGRGTALGEPIVAIPGTLRFREGRTSFKRITEVSRLTGFSFIRDAPMVAAVALNPRLALLALLSVVVLLGEALILLITFRSNYRPLVRLFHEIGRGPFPGGEGDCGDDIGRIRQTIDGYRSDLESARSHEKLLSFLFGSSDAGTGGSADGGIGGSADDPAALAAPNELEPILSALGLTEEGVSYGVVLIAVSGIDSSQALRECQRRLAVAACQSGIVLADPVHPRLIVVAGLQRGRDPDALLRLLEEGERFGTAMAAGRFRPEAGALRTSLREAEEALAFAVFHSIPAVAYEGMTLRKAEKRLGATIRELDRSLSMDDPSSARGMLETVLATVRDDRLSIATVREISGELRHLFLRELGGAARLPRDEPATADEFSALFTGLFTRLVADRDEARLGQGHNRSRSERSRAERVRSRIEKELSAPDFTLHAILRDEKLSPSGLSALFRNAYGETISDFVSRSRIEAAKVLLSEGRSVKETTVLVGYLDATSFIRKFRKHTGLTPGEWAERRTAENIPPN